MAVPQKTPIRRANGLRVLISSINAALNEIWGSVYITSGTSYTANALEDVTTSSQTRTVDCSHPITTIRATEDFTIDATGPAGKVQNVAYYIFNDSGSNITVTNDRTGDTFGVTAGNTVSVWAFWNGNMLHGTGTQTGDARPT